MKERQIMKNKRIATVNRKTTETDIKGKLDLDGKGIAAIQTGIGFFDHMLEQLTRHSLIDIDLKVKGDLHIDTHHTVEDCGWALGSALNEALGNRQGIRRYASCLLPMDEALVRVVIDISGRPHLIWRLELASPKLGDMETEVFKEFFQSFSQAAGITLHVEQIYGGNAHHIIEACFKGLARSLREAITLDPREEGRIPSTKGMLGGSPSK